MLLARDRYAKEAVDKEDELNLNNLVGDHDHRRRSLPFYTSDFLREESVEVGGMLIYKWLLSPLKNNNKTLLCLQRNQGIVANEL